MGNANGADIIDVQNNLHGQEYKKEADGITNRPRLLNAGGSVLGLADVIIECKDRSREVEWGVSGVCDVVPEGVVFGAGRYGYSIALRQVCRVQLLLLWQIRRGPDVWVQVQLHIPRENWSRACQCSSSNPS